MERLGDLFSPGKMNLLDELVDFWFQWGVSPLASWRFVCSFFVRLNVQLAKGDVCHLTPGVECVFGTGDVSENILETKKPSYFPLYWLFFLGILIMAYHNPYIRVI